MKRLTPVLTVLLIVALMMTGCSELLFTTDEYRSYQRFLDHHQAGTERQAVMDELGCPDGYYDDKGAYHHIPYLEEDAYKEILLDEGTVFVYECYKRPDPAEPYRLRITFDSEGKSTEAELVIVPGG